MSNNMHVKEPLDIWLSLEEGDRWTRSPSCNNVKYVLLGMNLAYFSTEFMKTFLNYYKFIRVR